MAHIFVNLVHLPVVLNYSSNMCINVLD